MPKIWLAAALFSLALVSAQTAAPPAVSLSIAGDIQAPLTLSSSDLAQMPRQTAVLTGEDGMKVTYEGVLLRDVLQRAGLQLGHELRGKGLAAYLVASAHDGYQVVFSLGEIAPDFGADPILIADKRDGKPLFGYQGPLRLICPNDKAGARSVRMLESIKFVRLPR